MTTQKEGRRNITYRLDGRILDTIESLALKTNMSCNKYVENLLFAHGKISGEIPIDALPLGETRGRSSASRKERLKINQDK